MTGNYQTEKHKPKLDNQYKVIILFPLSSTKNFWVAMAGTNKD